MLHTIYLGIEDYINTHHDENVQRLEWIILFVSVSFLREDFGLWCHQCRKYCTAGWLSSGYVPLWPSVVATSSVSLSPLDMGTSAVPKFGSVPSLLLLLWCSGWPRCFSALVPPVFGIKLSPALQQALLFRNSRLARVFITYFLFFFPKASLLSQFSQASCFVLGVSVELSVLL